MYFPLKKNIFYACRRRLVNFLQNVNAELFLDKPHKKQTISKIMFEYEISLNLSRMPKVILEF